MFYYLPRIPGDEVESSFGDGHDLISLVSQRPSSFKPGTSEVEEDAAKRLAIDSRYAGHLELECLVGRLIEIIEWHRVVAAFILESGLDVGFELAGLPVESGVVGA